jgi:hypothetical protein
MYGRLRKSWLSATGPTIRTTSGIGLSGCGLPGAGPPPGACDKLEANKIAETEIRARASVICSADARVELFCFFFMRGGGTRCPQRVAKAGIPPGYCCVRRSWDGGSWAFGDHHRLEDKTIHPREGAIAAWRIVLGCLQGGLVWSAVSS